MQQLRPLRPEPREQPRLDPAASYLVTGAFGGIGRPLVEWLVAAGARQLVLVGRNPPDTQARDWLERLHAAGVRCEAVAIDVAADGAAAALVARAQALGPLRGVLHAAGALADAAIGNLDAARLALPLRAKVAGAWALHAATRSLALDHFVLFSSAAALLGPHGQANHAAANAAMDALAHRRRALGLPALSVNWGAWADAGAAMRADIAQRVQRSGLVHMAPQAALTALGWAMSGTEVQLMVADADWAGYARRYPHAAVPPLLQPLVDMAVPTVAPAPQAVVADLREQLQALPPLRRLPALRDVLRQMAAGILRLPAQQLEPDHLPLRELGLDSLMSIELRNLIAARLGRKLPATLLFDHPSVASLADALAADVLAYIRGLLSQYY